MRRLFAWVACAGGAAFVLLRRLHRRREPEATADPAEALKRKLEESRSAEPSPPAPEPAGGSLDERRRAVHERARAAIDDMRAGDPPPDS